MSGGSRRLFYHKYRSAPDPRLDLEALRLFSSAIVRGLKRLEKRYVNFGRAAVKFGPAWLE
jgi:hypothetical protein